MIIVGLGNAGQAYVGTRHNIGFDVVDAVAQHHHLSWTEERGVRWARFGVHLLLKPQEFMNASGQSLQNFFQYKHLDWTPEELVVIHDDLDFPLGEVHQQHNRSAGGHNGIQSIIDVLGTQDFRRIRIGIGNNRDQNIPAETYVLQHFSNEQRPLIDQTITDASAIVDRLISNT